MGDRCLWGPRRVAWQLLCKGRHRLGIWAMGRWLGAEVAVSRWRRRQLGECAESDWLMSESVCRGSSQRHLVISCAAINRDEDTRSMPMKELLAGCGPM